MECTLKEGEEVLIFKNKGYYSYQLPIALLYEDYIEGEVIETNTEKLELNSNHAVRNTKHLVFGDDEEEYIGHYYSGCFRDIIFIPKVEYLYYLTNEIQEKYNKINELNKEFQKYSDNPTVHQIIPNLVLIDNQLRSGRFSEDCLSNKLNKDYSLQVGETVMIFVNETYFDNESKRKYLLETDPTYGKVVSRTLNKNSVEYIVKDLNKGMIYQGSSDLLGDSDYIFLREIDYAKIVIDKLNEIILEIQRINMETDKLTTKYLIISKEIFKDDNYFNQDTKQFKKVMK